MPAPPRDDDLLQPTLTAEDDAEGFGSPWNPHSLALTAFFAGPFGGGTLLALNFDRLGRPRQLWTCLAAFFVLGIVGYPLGAWLAGEEAADSTNAILLGMRVVVVAAALFFARRQERRFRIFQSAGGEPAHALGPGLLAVVAGRVVDALWLSLATGVLEG